MEKKFRKSLFIFRRDLRLEDNTGLIFALQASETVIPAFIFTPEQIDNNPYRSDHCLKFMLESLEDLDGQLKQKGAKLFFFKGEPDEIASRCIKELHVDAVIVNRDYTPYSLQRDQKLEGVCKAHHAKFHSFDDALLHPPEKTLKKDGNPYTVFTPFFHNASQLRVSLPTANLAANYYQGSISFAKDSTVFPKLNVKTHLIGGRTEALKILKNISAYSQYVELRDFPAKDYCTHLSPYLKFTVCSPREVYAALRHQFDPQHGLIRALYWRDFFTSIALFHPYVFKGSFRPKYDALKWSNNRHAFEQWCKGMTGFPIVDAGMREMNSTGFMHNRVRMITASLLIKDLHIDWRWGEKYFAQTLIDYDPAVNNGNWQWVASTGCDAQPYFRIFNPWNQQEKFDPDCLYIKKWIPELKNFSPKSIHKWYDEKYRAGCRDYPAPITDHKEAAATILAAYQSL